jgi:hypothetical protein
MFHRMTEPWDVFGGDDEDNDDDADEVAVNISASSSSRDQYNPAVSVSTALIQRWLNHSDVSSLQYRRILILLESSTDDNVSTSETPSMISYIDEKEALWKDVFKSKRINDVTVTTPTINDTANRHDNSIFYDAIIWLRPSQSHINSAPGSLIRYCESTLITGGYLVISTSNGNGDVNKSVLPTNVFAESVWDVESATMIKLHKESKRSWSILPKWSCGVDTDACTWSSHEHSQSTERRLLSLATISLSVHERENGYLNSTLLSKAVMSLKEFGYCVVSGLLYKEREICLEYGAAAMSDIHAAAAILKSQDVDIFQPSLSIHGPGSYRELSMREHCRMDIRHGPALEALRGENGNSAVVYKASDQGDINSFLRGNVNILSIVRRAMNPCTPKHRTVGNYGRYNFEGSGPDGSDRDLVAGPVGAIVNLPGSADQAIHADTPHLFEHVINPSPLPPHYINVFTLGCLPADNVGQTAFIHGSHSMEYVSNHIRDGSLKDDCRDPFLPSLWKNLIRPRMNLGDVVLFDCRILHFGLSNRHQSMARPMIYSNMTLHWFNDPKNWDDHVCIFTKH